MPAGEPAERPMLEHASLSPLVFSILGVLIPVCTLACTVATFCATRRRRASCLIRYPLISDASRSGAPNAVFAFGMVLTLPVIAIPAVFVYHPWTRMWIVRGTRAGTWRRTLLCALNVLSTSTGTLAAFALGALAVVPLSLSDDWHVFFVKSYFGLASLWMAQLQLLLALAPRPPQPDWVVALKRACAALLLLLCPLFYIMHQRIFFPEIFGIPQLAYALVESACVLLTVFHPVLHLVEVHQWGTRMVVALPAPPLEAGAGGQAAANARAHAE